MVSGPLLELLFSLLIEHSTSDTSIVMKSSVLVC